MNRRALLLAHDVADGLRSQPRRTLLALSAMAIGMTALTILLAVLSALRDKADRIAGEFGANVVALTPERTDPSRPLGEAHLAVLRAAFPDCRLAAVARYRVPTFGRDEALDVAATDPQLAAIRRWPVLRGRFLDATDLQERQRHAVITSALSRSAGLNPGDLILLRDLVFRIVGVLDPGGDALQDEGAGRGLAWGRQTVFVPRSLPPYWAADAASPSPAHDAILLEAPDAERFDAVLRAAPRLFDQPDLRHRTPPLQWVTQSLLLEGVRTLRRLLHGTAGSIALLCLALGGTTLMSLLLANVQERIPEIGLRRALGASPSDVGALFLLEGCVVTLAGGLVGAWAGSLLLRFAAPLFPFPVRIGAWEAAAPLGAALLLGVLFSYGPARQAARTPPSQALRNA